LNVLAQVARDGGKISNHDRHLKILAAVRRGDKKTAELFTRKYLASILQTVRGRRWLLENKEKGLSAPPAMRKWARQNYEAFYAADVRRLGRVKADKKWKGTETPRFKLDLILHLGTFAPLVCAVHSGGKSLHGWFYVQGQPDVKVEKFFRYAVSLGADRATWTRSQFVRMPDGTRNNDQRQTVFFLNSKSLEVKHEHIA